MSTNIFQQLKIFSLNIRSLRQHYDELNIFLNNLSFKYNIIVLTEVWVKNGEENRYCIPGYDMHLQQRDSNQAGGTIIYVDSDIEHSYQLLALPTAEIVNVVLSVKLSSNRLLEVSIFGIYRNCKFTFKEFKPELENLLKITNDPLIIIGDLNICLLQRKGSGREYLDLISSYGFESLINKPTRIFNNTRSCIDHAIVRNSKKLNIESSILELDITDHYAIELSIGGLDTTVRRPKYCKVLDKDMLSRQLRLADWGRVMNEDNVNCCTTQFYGVYNSCVDASYYLKIINSQNRKRNEWVSDNLVTLINRKNSIFKCYCRNRDDLELKIQYKNLSKNVKQTIRSEKRRYFSALVDRCNGDSRSYWNIIKRIIKSKRKSINDVLIDGKLVNVLGNEQRVADEFNRYFTTVISTLRNEAFGSDLFIEDNNIYDVFIDKFTLTNDIVIKSITSLGNKPSCGVDGISIHTIKSNIDVFAPLLHNIFLKSLNQGIMPVEFKTAAVVPVYKTGNVADVSSYRPISIISTIAKIFETIIKNQLLNYFNGRNLFSKHQYGFLPGKGTDLAIEKHITSLTTSIDSQKYTLAIYLDFQKAFDVIDLNILIGKFRMYGIGGLALSWLESFCRNRRQVVKINNQYGKTFDLQYGTAQGGVLGPIIFLIFINDMLNMELNSAIFAYADDTALVCSAYNRQLLKSKISKDLDKISNWLISNKLLINVNKSKCIMFFDHDKTRDYLENMFSLYCHKHHCIYDCLCSVISVVSSVKYLGLYVDQRLKWDEHIIYLAKKLRKVNYAIYHMKSFIRADQLKRVYMSWFESTVRYGIMHFGGTYTSILKPVVMCQRHSLRIIYNIKYNERLTYIFEEHDILNVIQLYKYALIMYVSKYFNQFRIKQVNRITRSSQFITLDVPFFTKEMSRHQFCFLGPKIFNNFVIFSGNHICYENKIKVKMKAREFVGNPS